MSSTGVTRLASEPATTVPLTIAIIGAATIIGAWIFQYGFGILPCPLCLEQRIAYYFAIPLAVLLAIGASVGASRRVLIAGLVVIAAGMLWNAGLGAYHAGVEWGFWQGPQDCTGPINDLGTAGGLLKQLESVQIVRCDEVQWRFLGLSLAGYNALISLALAGIAAWGAQALWRSDYGSSSVSQ
ncbi:MAG: disulfide bond formation protein B [Pseudorhodoplanes sp.]|nr:disulfide bond formation protein B [Pseudorhodoplanes sp.]